MSNPISPTEINSILWKACDTFRGTVDPSEYKNYILVMLFVKYISDVWQEKVEQYITQQDHYLKVSLSGFSQSYPVLLKSPEKT